MAFGHLVASLDYPLSIAKWHEETSNSASQHAAAQSEVYTQATMTLLGRWLVYAIPPLCTYMYTVRSHTSRLQRVFPTFLIRLQWAIITLDVVCSLVLLRRTCLPLQVLGHSHIRTLTPILHTQSAHGTVAHTVCICMYDCVHVQVFVGNQ